jgi:hypothetical protein
MPSLTRTLAKLSLKTGFDGATVMTTFTVGPDVEEPSIDLTYQLQKTDNLERRLKPEQVSALDTLVREAVDRTKSTLIEKNMYNQDEFCRASLDQLGEYYDYFLKKDLPDGSKISIMTTCKAGDETQESFCQCETHKVTGQSLRSRSLAIVTRVEGGQCTSKYLVLTRPGVMIAPYIPLTSNQVTSYTRYLDKGTARAQALLSAEGGTLTGFGTQNRLLHALDTIKKEDPSYEHLNWQTQGYDDTVKDSKWVPFMRRKVLYHPISLGSTSDSSASSTDGIIWASEDLRRAAKEKLDAGPWVPPEISDWEAAEIERWTKEGETTPELASLKPIKSPSKREGSHE